MSHVLARNARSRPRRFRIKFAPEPGEPIPGIPSRTESGQRSGHSGRCSNPTARAVQNVPGSCRVPPPRASVELVARFSGLRFGLSVLPNQPPCPGPRQQKGRNLPKPFQSASSECLAPRPSCVLDGPNFRQHAPPVLTAHRKFLECFGKSLKGHGGTTGIEPATSDVTDLRSGPLESVDGQCFHGVASANFRHGML